MTATLPQPYRVTKSTMGGLNILLYGNQGVGKTVLAAQAADVPDMQDVLFLNVERGLMSVAERDDIDAVDITSSQQAEQVFWAIQGKQDGYDKYKTVIIDSITDLQKIDLEERAAGKKRTLAHYGDSTAYLEKVFRFYRDLPLNVILIATPSNVTDDEEGNLLEVIPNLTPKLADRVMAYQDAVWFYYWRDKDKKRVLLTQPHGPYRAKTRGIGFSEALGNTIVDPSMADIYNLFQKGGK